MRRPKTLEDHLREVVAKRKPPLAGGEEMTDERFARLAGEALALIELVGQAVEATTTFDDDAEIDRALDHCYVGVQRVNAQLGVLRQATEGNDERVEAIAPVSQKMQVAAKILANLLYDNSAEGRAAKATTR